MRDSNMSNTIEDSPPSSPRPSRSLTPDSTLPSEPLTFTSLQQQQQQKKKKKKTGRKKKKQPSNLQSPKQPPSLLPPAKALSPMATPLLMYAPDSVSSTSACVLTGSAHRVRLMKWTSPLSPVPEEVMAMSPILPLHALRHPRCSTIVRQLNPLTGAIVACILVMAGCLIPQGPPTFIALSFHTRTLLHQSPPLSSSITSPSTDPKSSVPLTRVTPSTVQARPPANACRIQCSPTYP